MPIAPRSIDADPITPREIDYLHHSSDPWTGPLSGYERQEIDRLTRNAHSALVALSESAEAWAAALVAGEVPRDDMFRGSGGHVMHGYAADAELALMTLRGFINGIHHRQVLEYRTAADVTPDAVYPNHGTIPPHILDNRKGR